MQTGKYGKNLRTERAFCERERGVHRRVFRGVVRMVGSVWDGAYVCMDGVLRGRAYVCMNVIVWSIRKEHCTIQHNAHTAANVCALMIHQ